MIMCMSDIICVTNRKLCREDFLTRIERIAACRPAGIILREKDMLLGEYIKLAEAVIEICDKYGVKCILHNFPSVVKSIHANAIHVPLHILRTMSQEQKVHFSILGTSCHSVEDSLEAQALGCTYIIAGHVFETNCKRGLLGRGPDFLRNVCTAVKLPVYGIGGIGIDNITLVRDTGVAGVCLMSSLMEAENVTELMKAMRR